MTAHLARTLVLCLLPSGLLLCQQELRPAITFDPTGTTPSSAGTNSRRISDRIQLTDTDIYLSFLTPSRGSRQFDIFRVSRVGLVVASISLASTPPPVSVTFDEAGEAFVVRG